VVVVLRMLQNHSSRSSSSRSSKQQRLPRGGMRPSCRPPHCLGRRQVAAMEGVEPRLGQRPSAPAADSIREV
jgi:hypothetical protein